MQVKQLFLNKPGKRPDGIARLPKAQAYPQKKRSKSRVKPHSPSRESVKLSTESTSPAPMCRKICFTPENPATNAPGMDTKKNNCTPVRSHVRRFLSCWRCCAAVKGFACVFSIICRLSQCVLYRTDKSFCREGSAGNGIHLSRLHCQHLVQQRQRLLIVGLSSPEASSTAISVIFPFWIVTDTRMTSPKP